jgi:hypothetical protein
LGKKESRDKYQANENQHLFRHLASPPEERRAAINEIYHVQVEKR